MIFIPILRELPDSKKYHKYVRITYISGFAMYIYIAFAGATGTFPLTQQS